MELTTIRELYKNSDSYMDQKVTIGGWVRSIRGSKAFGFIVVNDEHSLSLYRLYITTRWTTLQRSPS